MAYGEDAVVLLGPVLPAVGQRKVHHSRFLKSLIEFGLSSSFYCLYIHIYIYIYIYIYSQHTAT